MSSKKYRTGECAYCHEKAVTADHIPPRGLFPKNDRKILIKVPACEKCNREASDDDEDFRLALALRYDVVDHPAVQGVIPAIMRSLEKPEKVGFRNAFYKGLRRVYPQTASGLILPQRLAYAIDIEGLERVVKRITKALYFHHRGKQRLPDEYEATAFAPERLAMMRPEERARFKRTFLDPLEAEPNKIIGARVFIYKYRFEGAEPDASAWLYLFYQRIPFVGIITSKNRTWGQRIGLDASHVFSTTLPVA